MGHEMQAIFSNLSSN